jgi:acetyl-CoA carboxylase carboxyltransferase component
VPDERSCFARVRELLAYLPQNHLEAPPRVNLGDDPERCDDEIAGIVPVDQRQPYDVRKVICRLADAGAFFEVQEEWAANIVIGFMRLDGRTVGVIANQAVVMGGVLTVNASDKCARFIRFCDCFNISLLYAVDVPGYLPGIDQERAGIIRHGAKMLYAYCEASVPKITLVLRKGYGGGILAMGGNKGLGADVILAWPGAEMAVVGAEAAVDLIMRKEIKAADNPNSFREEKIKWYRDTYQNPYYSAECGAIDDIIEPRQTRRILIRHFEFLTGKREDRPRKKHGNIPL